MNKFTIGVYLNHYRYNPYDYSTIEIVDAPNNQISLKDSESTTNKGVLILRDDLKFNNQLIFKDMLDWDYLKDQSLEIQSTIKKSLNNVKFVSHEFHINEKLYTIICSDIPQVCSDIDASGVTFIIIEDKYTPIDDLSYLMRIFNRVAANYVYKYNECVVSQIISTKMNEKKKPVKNHE